MPIVKPVPAVLAPYMKVRGKKRRLRGVFVGGCVARGDGSSFRRKAHAHCFAGDPYRGWICVRAVWRLEDERMMLHELSHILTGQGHTQKFFAKFVELGGSLEDDPAWLSRLAFQERQRRRQELGTPSGLAELLRF